MPYAYCRIGVKCVLPPVFVLVNPMFQTPGDFKAGKTAPLKPSNIYAKNQ